MTQAKLGTFGQRLTGLDEARQTVLVMVGTQRGAVPHSPDLGVDWLDIIDRPVSDALRLLVLQVEQQFRIHAPHLVFRELQMVGHSKSGQPRIRVLWSPYGADSVEETEV